MERNPTREIDTRDFLNQRHHHQGASDRFFNQNNQQKKRANETNHLHDEINVTTLETLGCGVIVKGPHSL